MALTLSITNVERLDNGVATRLRLDRHGAVIGRSPHVDWSLPDPRNYISSVHCEIEYRDGGYTLVDKSTNGTFLNGAPERMQGPHRIDNGDVILVGHYSILAAVEGAPSAEPASQEPVWTGWDSHAGGPAPAAAPPGASGWDRPSAEPAISGVGPLSQHWAAPSAQPDPSASVWASASPAPSASSASSWSSPVEDSPRDASATDVWGRLEAGNVVDWARGFSAPSNAPASPAADPLGLAPPPAKDPFGLSAPSAGVQMTQAPAAQAVASLDWGSPAGDAPRAPASPQPASRPAPPPAPVPAAAPPASQAAGGEWTALLQAMGLSASDLKSAPPEAAAAAGAALRRLVGGVVVMLEARARAKAQLGAQGTALELDGNNPLKFARTPEQALAQLLNPPQRGFMTADRAVEAAFQDLQAHQMATLAAMQGALRATLARFSPEAIRNRAESRGLLAKIIPGGRDAALWKAYEREFDGVAHGSAEAFMDVFAKEFKEAYERTAAEMKRR